MLRGASPEPTRAAGLRRLDEFVCRAGPQYAKSRNFDLGAGNRGNVSLLSPYVRHRLVLEQEVLETTLQRHSLTAAGKFVQEVFWRSYFKGWLEQRPDVWTDYRADVARLVIELQSDPDLNDRYTAAITGTTGIDCFDSWAAELVHTGYLHNHARMWFASIWVFTLKLPWQLGADFFYRHLLDGDPASNTLSWRWVCGLHTQGKTYLARASNIATYTDHRFSPEGQLASTAPALSESRAYPLRALPEAHVLNDAQRFGLLITEEDACPEGLLGDRSPVSVIGVLATRLRSSLPVGALAQEFARGAVADAVVRSAQLFGAGEDIVDTDEWGDLLVEWATRHRLAAIATPFAPAGPVAEQLLAARDKLDRYGIPLLQLRRAYDDATWPHATRGYFRLKRRIPEILGHIGIDIPEQNQASEGV